MVKQLLKQIQMNQEVRQNLSKLRQEMKDFEQAERAKELFEDIELQTFLITLLENEDAKTRKNCALLMGDLGCTDFLKPLYAAYEKEEQLFVKGAYLQAMGAFDYHEYLPQLNRRLEELQSQTLTEENRKHITEESRALSELVVAVQGITQHEFRGSHELSDIILLTNRKHAQVTAAQITEDSCEVIPVGVRLTTNHLDKIIPIRTYQELLFVVDGMKNCDNDPLLAAQKVAESDLLNFLEKRHKGKAPFYFRIEMKTRMELDKKSTYVKKMSAQIERATNRQLINSVSNYEVEIRLIQNKEGRFNILVKLLTLPDERFSYRKESIATSIRPVNAALLVELAKEYMIPDAKVLDPFCGVATMLIERQKAVPGNTAYGIDILEEAILKARINTQEAGQIIHFINKDFFEFSHEYLFDEIFTNMPFAIGRVTEDDIYELYEEFFDKAKTHLFKTGRIIMYTHDALYVNNIAPKKGYRILQRMEVMDKEGTSLFILENK